MRVHIRIERLVLDGLPVTAPEAPRIREAVEHELARLLAVNGLSHELRSGGAFPLVSAPDLPLADVSNPREIGQEIARSVYKGIGR